MYFGNFTYHSIGEILSLINSDKKHNENRKNALYRAFQLTVLMDRDGVCEVCLFSS